MQAKICWQLRAKPRVDAYFIWHMRTFLRSARKFVDQRNMSSRKLTVCILQMLQHLGKKVYKAIIWLQANYPCSLRNVVDDCAGFDTDYVKYYWRGWGQCNRIYYGWDSKNTWFVLLSRKRLNNIEPQISGNKV